MAYLDNNGVLYLWGKIKAHVSAAIGALTIPTKTITSPVKFDNCYTYAGANVTN